MTKRGIWRVTLSVAALVLVTSPMPAQADETSTDVEVVHGVLLSADPEAALAELSTEELAIFVESLQNQDTVETVTGGTYEPSARERALMHQGAPADAAMADEMTLAAASGCWYKYWFLSWYDLGVHTGDTWMQLNWCGSGGNISSWSVTNVGGRGDNGNSYNGVSSKGSRNVGWEIRAFRGFDFDYFGWHAYPCMQIRGGATGLYSTRKSCDLS